MMASKTIFLGRPTCRTKPTPPERPFPRARLLVRQPGCRPDITLCLLAPLVPFHRWLLGLRWWILFVDPQTGDGIEIDVTANGRGTRHRVRVWRSPAAAEFHEIGRVLLFDRRFPGPPSSVLQGLPLTAAAAKKLEVANV